MWIGKEPYRHAFLLDAADDRGLLDSSSTWQDDSIQPHCHFISESMYLARAMFYLGAGKAEWPECAAKQAKGTKAVGR
jgi:hypothetical protein